MNDATLQRYLESRSTAAMCEAARRFKALLPRYYPGKTGAGARKLLAFTATHYAANPGAFVAESQAEAVRFVARKVAWTIAGVRRIEAAIDASELEGWSGPLYRRTRAVLTTV